MFARVILPLLLVGLALYALLDLAASDEKDRGGVPRWLWVVIIVLLPGFGPVAWIIVRRSGRRADGGGSAGRPGQGRGPRRPSGPVAPDDDPDFLWKLEQDRRRRERERGGDGNPPR